MRYRSGVRFGSLQAQLDLLYRPFCASTTVFGIVGYTGTSGHYSALLCVAGWKGKNARNQATCVFGLPPRLPFSRLACVLTALRALPPCAPSCAAIQDFEPNTPSNNAGR